MASFDYIIVGGGSAGCVLANRLSEDAGISVLLLEAGGNDTNPWIHIPVGYIKTMVDPGVNWLFETEPDEKTFNRPIPVPRGKVLGGSSSINAMIYARGNARDYNDWAQLGNRGWAYEDVLPYFRKSENFERGGDELRGSGGLLNVADVTEKDPLLDAVIRGSEEAGIPRNDDYNGASQEGIMYSQLTQKNGRRHSAKTAFLNPVRKRPNLTIETHAHATGVILEGKRATGVRYIVNGQTREVRANAEVIVSAGGVQSPQLLELSGIGQPELLKSHGIEPHHELKGVGENLQDHYASRLQWRVRNIRTLNEKTKGLLLVREVAKYLFAQKGALTMPAGILLGFVRTRPELETPDIQFHIANASFKDPKKRVFDSFPGLTFAPCQLRPESRGSIHIASPDPFAAPRIRPNFLSASIDCETHVAGMRLARDIISAPALKPYIDRENVPGASCDTDEGLLDYARQTGATMYHPTCTCAMGPDPANGAVVDASIMPRLTSGNTNAPVIMIAEKAADMIKQERKN